MDIEEAVLALIVSLLLVATIHLVALLDQRRRAFAALAMFGDHVWMVTGLRLEPAQRWRPARLYAVERSGREHLIALGADVASAAGRMRAALADMAAFQSTRRVGPAAAPAMLPAQPRRRLRSPAPG